MSTFENIVITDTDTIKIKGPISVSGPSAYFKALNSKKKPVLVRRISPESIHLYEKEVEGYGLVKSHQNCLKMTSHLILNSFGIIIYEYPENLDMNSSFGHLIKEPKIFIDFLKQLTSILNFLHSLKHRYNHIDKSHLFFDKKHQLKLAGFSGMQKVQRLGILNDENFRIVTGCSEIMKNEQNDCLGTSFDYLMLGEFLKKDKEILANCFRSKGKNLSKTKEFINSVIFALCHKNMTLRSNYEDLMFMLNVDISCKEASFLSKQVASSFPVYQVKALLEQLLLDNDESFDICYLNKIVFLLRVDINGFKVFVDFFLEHPAPQNYGLTIKLLIINFYILVNFKFDQLRQIHDFSFVENCICEWFSISKIQVETNVTLIRLLEVLKNLIIQKIILNEEKSLNSLREIFRFSPFISYLKRINEFLKVLFEEYNESLFHLKDLTLIIVLQELYDLLNVIEEYRMLETPSEETEALTSSISSSLNQYKISINLNIIKNIPISRYPLIFKQFPTKIASFQLQSNFISCRSDSFFEIPIKQLPFENVFDMGGSCFMYKDVYEGKPIAIKELNLDKGNEIKTFSREFNILTQCFHPNIIQLIGTNTQSRSFNLIYPYMEGGNLHILLHKLQIHLNSNQKLSICIDICEAMNYLHKKNIIHRDLKALNILVEFKLSSLKDPISLKLSDFGDSRRLANDMTNLVGTMNWCSPELLAGEKYDFKTDVYSFGVVVWETFTRQIPFGEIERSYEVKEKILNGFRPNVQEIDDEMFDGEIKVIVSQCFEQDPKRRPDFQNILRRLRALVR